MRALLLFLAGCSSSTAPPPTLASVGEAVFFDTNLSSPAGQSCADCHDPKLAFVDPEGDRTSAGAVPGRFGPRNAPTLMYAAFIPNRHVDVRLGVVGGLFLDGRATTLEEQALAPFLNPLEMANPDKASVVAKVKRARYAGSFRRVFGPDIFDDGDRAFAAIGEALAAFERTPRFAPFASRYDRSELDAAEQRGLALFLDPARGNCASCHPPPLFTNHAYAKLGLPQFRDSPYLDLGPDLNPEGRAFVDHGLMVTTGDPRDDGRFRIPTLRNLPYTQPYGHNGYYRQIREMVDFHVDRGISGTLDGREREDVVAFLSSLTDPIAK